MSQELKYPNECVICGEMLESISTNHNGAEWVGIDHTEEEWKNWCEKNV